jgi:membrane-bound acyltransferase YfiQ involved in biofilm formation
MKRGEVHEIYTVRALACLTIVLLHSMGAVSNARPEVDNGIWAIVAVVLKFGTPVFVMVSACVLAYSNSYRATPPSMFRKRAAKLLPPFVIIGAFYAVVSWYTDDLTAPEAVARFGSNMVLAGYHGYFILIVLQFLAIFGAFKRLAAKVGMRRMVVGTLFVNAAWLAFFNFVPAPNSAIGELIWYRISWLPFPGWLFFFTAAYYLGANLQATRRLVVSRPTLLLCSTAAAAVLVAILFSTDVITTDSSKRVDMLLLAPLAFLMFFLIGQRKPSRFIMWVSENSFGIYLLHFFFIAVTETALEQLPLSVPPLLSAITFFVIGTTLSGFAAVLVRKVPFGELAVGPGPKKKASPSSEPEKASR